MNKQKSWDFAVLAMAALALMLALGEDIQPAYAAAILVNGAGDVVANDGVCTLREAITAANTDTASGAAAGECAAGAGADNISFAANYTITLAGNQLPIITTQMTITGTGAANTIIQANAAPNTATYRVFEIAASGNAVLENMTIRHGRCTVACSPSLSNGGGGSLNQGTLTLNAVTVSSNTADVGGGIFNRGTLTVQNGSLVGGAGMGNTANLFGGGILNQGTLTVDVSTVSANTAGGGGGGGILSNGTLNVQNGSVIGGTGAGNTSTGNGGGISNNGGIATVNASTVSANTSNNDGGGIYNSNTLNVQNGSVIGGAGAGNTAGRGGGIANRNAGTATVDASTVSANTATTNGGGILSDGTLNVQNGSVIGGAGAGNTANNGGGIYNFSGTTTVNASTVSVNSATSGGGIGNSGLGTLNVVNGSVIGGPGMGNIADSGGGIFNLRTLTVSTSTISNNSAGFVGGGVNSNMGASSFTNSTISNNVASIAGGGIAIANTSTLSSLTNTTISGNTAPSGGGISNGSNPIAAITNVIVAGNVSGDCASTSGIPTGSGNFNGDGSCSGTWGTFTPGVDYDTALANNGGPTQTHALLVGSVAIDATGACPGALGGVDQRGEPRDAACDSGAYEFGPHTALAVSAMCNGADLDVTISTGDANFNISADDPGAVTQTQTNVAAGAYTLVSSTGYGTWTNISVTELSVDTETLNLTAITCPAPSSGGGGGVSATGSVLIDVMVDPHEAEIGDTALWTIRVWNPSNNSSGDVIVTAAFPADLKPLAGTLNTTRGTASFEGQTLTVESIGSLAPGEEARITVSTEVINASANLATSNQTSPVMLCVTGDALGATDTDCLNMPDVLPGTGGPSPVAATLYSLLPIVIFGGLAGISEWISIRKRRMGSGC